MKRTKIILLVLLLLLSWHNFTFGNEAVLREVLKNGLVVLAKESSPKDMVAIDISVRAAPLYEEEYLGTGISHLVEHMLFKGTATRKPGDIEKEVRSYGGLIDGSVSSDITSYQMTVPVKYFHKALALLKDMLLNASFDPAEIEKEREVILKEVILNNDDPMRKIILSLFLNSYVQHPYKYPAIGYEPLLRSIKRDDLIKYYDRRYTPNNIVISIVGGIDRREAISSVKKEFENFRLPSYKPPLTGKTEPPQIGKKFITQQEPVTLTYMAMGFHSTGILDKDLFAMDVLSTILGRGNNSRLNTVLVEEDRIAHSVSAANYTPQEPGLFIINVVLDKDNIEAAKAAILKELKKIREQDVSDTELETAKKTLLSDYIMSRETMEDQASTLGENEILTGNHDFSARYMEGIRKVTKSDLRRVASRYLNEENLTQVTFIPKTGEEPQSSDSLKQLDEEKMKKRVLKNGLVVLTRREAKIPACVITVAFSGGLLAENKENNGTSDMVASMLLDGTKKRSEADIKGTIESLGGNISSFSGLSSFGFTINILKGDMDFALALTKDIVTESTFPQDQIAKEKVLMMASIKEEDNDIFQRGGLTFKKGIFEGHPYAMRYAGELDTVSSLRRDDLLNFYHTYCVPNNMVISVSGDIDPDKTFNKIDALFKDLPRKELPKRPVIEMAPGKIRKELLKMDKEETLLIVGFRTVGIDNPDKYPLDVLDTILSGMSGRLFSSIRGKSAAAYTLGCMQKLGLDTGFVLFYVATSKDKLELAKEKLFNEIRTVRDKLVTDVELNSAKLEIISNYKMSMQTNASYSFEAALNELYGIGFSSIYDYENNISKVTKEDVKRVADKYLDLNAYTEVVVEGE